MQQGLSLRELSSVLGISPQGGSKVLKSSDAETYMNKKTKMVSPKSIRNIFEDRGFQFPKKKIMFHAIKGGCGKTTLFVNTLYRFSQLGAKCLGIVVDKQNDSSRTLGIQDSENILIDLITGEKSIHECIQKVNENLYILPSGFRNARIETELAGMNINPESFYNKLLREVEDDFDIIAFDMPPDLNKNSYLISLYCDTVIIPTEATEYSTNGTNMTLASLEEVRENYPNLQKDFYIVWSKYDARARNSLHFITEFENEYDANIFPVIIRNDSTYRNAQAENKTIFEDSKNKKSPGYEDIDMMAQEILGMRDFFSKEVNV